MSKRKILTLALSICMIAILVVGGTLAYMTDTDNQKNEFTIGNVKINLDEVKIGTDENGYPVTGTTRTEGNQIYKLRPNFTIDKDPTITLLEGSEDAYMGAIVTIKCGSAQPTDDTGKILTDDNGNQLTWNLHTLIGGAGNNIDITKKAEVMGEKVSIISGGLIDLPSEYVADWHGLSVHEHKADNPKYAVYQKVVKAGEEWVLYIFLEQPYEAGDKEVLFKNMNIPASYANNEMAVLEDLEINVQAFATQADGFDSCYEALTTAFKTEWNFQ